MFFKSRVHRNEKFNNNNNTYRRKDCNEMLQFVAIISSIFDLLLANIT
jgi:hypothetical protein